MNMFVGFACSVDIDMGFNAKHQHDEEGTEINDHDADSNPTHHDEAEEHQHHKKDSSEMNCLFFV